MDVRSPKKKEGVDLEYNTITRDDRNICIILIIPLRHLEFFPFLSFDLSSIPVIYCLLQVL